MHQHDMKYKDQDQGLQWPWDGDVGLLQGDFGSPLGGADSSLDPLTELGRPDEEQVLLLLRGDQHVVLVFAFFFGAVLFRKRWMEKF